MEIGTGWGRHLWAMKSSSILRQKTNVVMGLYCIDKETSILTGFPTVMVRESLASEAPFSVTLVETPIGQGGDVDV